MRTGDAFVFCLVGLGMILGPSCFPVFFPPVEDTGVNISGMWLEFMGWVNGSVGGGWLVRVHLMPLIQRALILRPVSARALIPAELLRPAREIYEGIESAADESRQSAA